MTEQKITEKNLVQQLRVAFPEIKDRYQERINTYKGDGFPGNYEVVGSVFKPKLKEELAKGEMTEFLRRAANLPKE